MQEHRHNEAQSMKSTNNPVFLCFPAFVGNSLSAILDGKARLLFLSRDEEYVITMPYAHCKGNKYALPSTRLIIPRPCCYVSISSIFP